jgi:MFS family permease
VFFGSNQSGLGCVWTDIAPNYSSSLNSLGNTFGSVAGILGPIVVAACTSTWPGVAGWRVAFLITFLLSCVTLALWFHFVKAELIDEINSPTPLPAAPVAPALSSLSVKTDEFVIESQEEQETEV